MPDPINVGLVGYGYAGRTFHAPLIASVAGLRLAAVASSDPARVAADWPDVAVVAGPAALCARADIDLVVVATPNTSHHPIARDALAAGKHVVVDKPFTVTLAEAEDLAALAGRAGRVLSVFHNRRWDADFLTLRRLLAAGALGRLAYLESRFDRFRPEVRDRWRERAGPGGGLWYDLGPHLADQALQLFGPPEALYADIATQRDGAVADDYFHVALRYGRTRVVLHASALAAASAPRFLAQGTGGAYVKHGLDPQEDALKAGLLPGGAGWGEDPQPGTLTLWGGGGPVTRAEPSAPGDYPAYYAGVRDAILGVGPNPVPAAEAIQVMRIIELARRSADERRELPVA
ncbi:MAG: oxidoreductase [Chloroflexales bacterium]|nr:oxidoreductase [Chloroflexales bacterium]